MRRAIARGRMFPQSYSTDRRYGRLSLKALGLFPLMWSNADDQGRLCGDPEEIKYAVCPNIDHITKQDIPGLLKELQDNNLILRYDTPKSAAIQMLDWWDANQKMQWAWPSQYLPPEGWQDHLRYKKDAKTVLTQSWPVSAEPSGDSDTIAQVSAPIGSGEDSGEQEEVSPLPTPSPKREREDKRGKRKRISPEQETPPQVSANIVSAEGSLPSPAVLPVTLLNRLTECYQVGWGTVHAEEPEKVIPRRPDARIYAQLRDLANELSSGGGCPLEYIDQAFKEAAGQQKYHISYVRAILLDWLGIERNQSP